MGKRKIIRLDMIEFICEGLNMKLKDFFNDPIFDNIKKEVIEVHFFSFL